MNKHPWYKLLAIALLKLFIVLVAILVIVLTAIYAKLRLIFEKFIDEEIPKSDEVYEFIHHIINSTNKIITLW